jgi:SpoVK/Ycf46/Vps4 family AAA+-type ATPase
MSELHLTEHVHPSREMMHEYEALVGIDPLKEALVDELILILDPSRLDAWQREHHPDGLIVLRRARSKAPLVLLSGDVGCGKTALASCVATPVAKAIDQRIVCLETPSDIRGRGHVGELSSRITEAFTQGVAKARSIGRGVLIIDEADDLATSRSQMQAHHEDRAGVNVLIKQIDQLSTIPNPMVVILITNRADVLDPAVRRRAALKLHFERPGDETRAAIFRRILEGTKTTEAEICELVALTKRNVPYTSSDLTDRIARLALRRAWKANKPFGPAVLRACISEISPTPLIRVGRQEKSSADL